MAKAVSTRKRKMVSTSGASITPKHFVDIQLVPPDDPKGLYFQRPDGQRLQLDDDESQFLNEIELAALRVSDTLQIPENRTEVLQYLLAAAQMGLGGPDPDLATGKSYFESFKAYVARAAEKERRAFILDVWQLSWKCLLFALPGIAIWVVVADGALGGWVDNLGIVTRGIGKKWLDILVQIIGIFGFALLGVVVGNLLVVFIRGRDMTFENFDMLSRYRFRPDMQLLYLSLLTIVVLILMHFKVIMIGVGNILLNDFSSNVPLSLVVGLVCALAEAVIVTLVVQNTQPTVAKSENQ